MVSRFVVFGALVATLGVACAGGDRRDVRPTPPAERDRLLFTGGADGYLYTVEPDGTDLRRLTRGSDWGAKSVAWAPNRARIAFVTVNVRRGSSALVVMRADGSGQRRLANFSGDDPVVRWPRSGQIEVRRRDWPHERMQVLTVPVDGGRLRRRGTEALGALSPDGTRLAFTRKEPNGDTQIAVGRPDGGGATNVSRTRSAGPGPLADTSPAWSPDGSRLAFLRDRGDGADVHLMDADGGNQRRLTHEARASSAPAWSPDGRRLAFVGNPDDDELQDLLVVPTHQRGRAAVVASFDYIESFAWRAEVAVPGGRPGTTPSAARPVRRLRTVSLAFAEGSTRLVDRRLLLRFSSWRDLPYVRDVAPDGRSFAYLRGRELRVYDLASDTTRLVARLRTTQGERHAAFSPDGRMLLYRSGSQLRVAEVRTRTSRPLAESRYGPFFWLRDGRVAYRAADGRLTFSRLGHAPRRTPFRLRDLRFALTSDGRRLLYDERCDTFLADVRTGRRKRLSGHLFVNPRAWAPDGSHFVLQWAEDCKAENGFVWAYHTHEVLFDRRGHRVAELPGEGGSWSRGSRWLLTWPRPTGTETSGLASILAVDVRARTKSAVLAYGNASKAFALPGDWLLFAAYDRPGDVAQGSDSGGLYVARLASPPPR